jgi:excisionase family DNA binding protein
MANYFVSGSIVARLKLRTSYLSSTEVMEILRRSRKTLCAWVKAGDIPAVRVGRDNKFDPWELALWIEARQLGQRAHAAASTISGSIASQLRLRAGYLKSTEVMGVLQVTRKTLCAWVKAGDIPADRVGRDNMFDSWELALWIEERQLGQRAHASGKVPVPAAA